MRRGVLGLDRVVALLLGLGLVAGGGAAVAWRTGWLARWWPGVPARLTTAPGRAAVDQPWWPWACGAAGVLAVVLGVWWLAAHLPRRSVGRLLLPGSDATGRLLLDPGGPATVAAGVLAGTPGVRSARGRVLRDRGVVVVTLDAVAEPHADLTDVAAAADAVTADLRTVLGRDDVAARVTLRIAARRRHLTRVH